MADLIITAPVQGWAAPLSEVPDPVFAECMMGDGVAIHPTGSAIHAPCDGMIVNLHAAHHAVTIRNAAGAEILVHTGLETVALGGRGFRALVAEGAEVSRGDPLIEFDMDAVALAATSLITPVVVTNSDSFRIERRTVGQRVGVGEQLMTLSPIAADEPVFRAEGETLRRTLDLPLVHGIHARPAARIGDCARAFEAEVEIVSGERRANVRSAVALMGLALKNGDTIAIEATGSDAAQALAAIGDLIASGMGEAHAKPVPAVPPRAAETPAGALAGVTASAGLTIGTAAWLADSTIAVEHDATDPAFEVEALDNALAKVRAEITAMAAQGDEAQRHILEAHLAFLDDADLRAEAGEAIAAGRSAGFGWRSAIAAQVAVLRGAGDARMAERAGDLEDIERQVLLALGGTAADAQQFAPETILLANDLLPSQLIALDTVNVVGIALVRGGPTSHVAILAGAKGLPLLVAMGEGLVAVKEGTTLCLDADSGLLHVDPAGAALDGHRKRVARAGERRAEALASAQQACRTRDGARIELFANLASREDAESAVANGAEGSGLLRTEFLFMGRAQAPSEDAQFETYQAIADAMDGRPVIVRLLDIGGDKPAPYLALGPETNPMLGQRGVRVLLARPDLLETQIRAILRVRPAGQCRIMVPMVSGLGELRTVRAAVGRVEAALGLAGETQVGVMIETPAAAASAALIAAEADFLSIGTNDLTQYTLAMDRENPAVAGGVDALHPAVLRLIAMTCEGGARHGRPVGVCGGLASDPLGIPLLIGLGVTELSTIPGFVPEAKALVRRLDRAQCRTLANAALDDPSAADIRARVRAFIEELN